MATPDGIHRFEAIPRSEHGGLFIDVPFDVKAAFGIVRPPVWVSLDGYRFQTTLSVFAGRSYIAVDAAHRDAAGVLPGETVRVEISSDDSLRTVELPPELKAVIRGKKGLLAAWAKLSYAERRDHARAISEAPPAAKAARVSEVISRLVSRS